MRVDSYGTDRLKVKNAREAIIKQIEHDFNLSHIFAIAHYEQMEKYFKEHVKIEPSCGQICYEAIAETEPPGKPLSECKRKAVKLTLSAPEDLNLLREKGLRATRQVRILRITNEAKEKGTELSHEDLANILCTSPSTIKRDIAELRKEGIVPTRGYMRDIGRGTSHKTSIIELYLRGYQFTEIEKMTKHSDTSIQRYLKGFTHIVGLTNKGLTVDEIRITTGQSERLIKEYQNLYNRWAKERKGSIRLQQIVKEFSSSKKKGVSEE